MSRFHQLVDGKSGSEPGRVPPRTGAARSGPPACPAAPKPSEATATATARIRRACLTDMEPPCGRRLGRGDDTRPAAASALAPHRVEPPGLVEEGSARVEPLQPVARALGE